MKNLDRVERKGMATKAGLLGLGVALLAAGGCSVLTSETIDQLADRGKAPSGVKYCLPRTMVEFVLSADPDRVQFKVTPGTPLTIKDTSTCYFLNYRAAPQYHDNITIQIGEKGYLKSIDADTKDKTVEIIGNLARAFGAFGGGLESARTDFADDEIARETVDPTDADAVRRLEASFTIALKAYAKARGRVACDTSDASVAKVPKKLFLPNLSALMRCKEFNRYYHMARPLTVRFDRADVGEGEAAHLPHKGYTKTRYEPAKTDADHHAPGADCRVGICYRAPEPWLLTIGIGATDVSGKAREPDVTRRGGWPSKADRIGHETVVREVLLVPNRAPLVEIDIRRAFLVNKVQNITFNEDGLFDSMQIEKGSELLALSSIPLEIVKNIAEGLAIRVKLLDTQINNTNSTRSLIEARTALQQQRQSLESYLARQPGHRGAATAARIPPRPLVTQSAKRTPIDAEPPIR